MSTSGPGNTEGRDRGSHAEGVPSADGGSNDTTRTPAAGASSIGEAPDPGTSRMPAANTGSGDADATREHTQVFPVSHTKDTSQDQHAGHRLDPDQNAARNHRAGSGNDGYRDRDAVPTAADRQALHQREKERFGGMKFGSAFFGWLTATGMAVLLTALLAAVGAAFGLSTNTNLGEAANQASQTAGIISAVVLLVLLLISYFAGGYVAGRMARFDGAKQGIAVWLWAVIIAIVVAVIGLIAGSQADIFANINSFPSLPVSEGDFTTAGIIAIVAAALTALLGAVLGGLAGMRYHRRIDRADFDEARS
ncbi:hypothetical protein [Arthrobacter sp. Br18]|uniref:hypothetical protein n=1 Tax=Arthrobacter sp. Br18 TaxID=1312954 RepID=UPI0004B445CD|nr:hypothetical protein [Arthrobacter sp. Br18]